MWLLVGCVFEAPGVRAEDGGSADCDAPETWVYDADGDGWGDERLVQLSCEGGHGLVLQGGDCDDLDLAVHPQADEVCDNGQDDDCDGPNGTLDGLVDCLDPDCAGQPGCDALTELVCDDGQDDDQDGDTDCDDVDCALDPACATGAGSGEIFVDPLVVDLGVASYPWFQVSTVVTVQNLGATPLTIEDAVFVDDADPPPAGLTYFLYTYGLKFPQVVAPQETFRFYAFCDVEPTTPPYQPDTVHLDLLSSDGSDPALRMTFTCEAAPS